MSKRKKNGLKATTQTPKFVMGVDHGHEDYTAYTLTELNARLGLKVLDSRRKPYKELAAMHGGFRCMWRTNHMQVCGKMRNTLRSAQRHLAEHVRRLHGEETRTTK